MILGPDPCHPHRLTHSANLLPRPTVRYLSPDSRTDQLSYHHWLSTISPLFFFFSYFNDRKTSTVPSFLHTLIHSFISFCTFLNYSPSRCHTLAARGTCKSIDASSLLNPSYAIITYIRHNAEFLLQVEGQRWPVQGFQEERRSASIRQ